MLGILAGDGGDEEERLGREAGGGAGRAAGAGAGDGAGGENGGEEKAKRATRKGRMSQIVDMEKLKREWRAQNAGRAAKNGTEARMLADGGRGSSEGGGTSDKAPILQKRKLALSGEEAVRILSAGTDVLVLRRRETPHFALHRRIFTPLFYGVSEIFLRPRKIPL